MSDTIRVLIAEDSPTVRVYLQMLIAEATGMSVIGTARNGEEGVALAQTLRPDIISMDIQMPRMDGLEATRRIMTLCPTPVVVVSGLLDIEVELALQALEAGALAVVSKPPDRQHPDFAAARQQLITTLKAMAGVRVIARRELLHPAPARPQRGAAVPLVRRRMRPEVLALGASTGGPSALYRLLSELPADFPLPIVIVQHMPTEFIAGLARWLNTATALEVVVAQDRQPLAAGQVVIAPGTAHLAVERSGTGLSVRLIRERGVYRHQPAVDVLFESIAQHCGSSAIGVVLTGMGDDGAAGLALMRQRGAYTFAQDEASCTVFGMPAAALARGAVEQIEPLVNLAPEIVKLI